MQITTLPPWIRNALINGYGFALKGKRFDRHFKETKAFLEQSQHWSANQIEDYQTERVAFILAEAQANVPFYARHFASCEFSARQFSCLSDLKRLAPVSKTMLREAGDDALHSRTPRRRSIACRTSGTTGEPFSFRLPRSLRFAFKAATLWRQYGWFGIRPGDRRITLGGRWFAARPPYWCVNHAEHQLLLSIHHLSEPVLDSYVERIRTFRPVFAQGHPSGLSVLARHLLNRNQTYPLRGVFVTGETLFPEQRDMMEKAFGCPVKEEYGLGECVFSAQQSPEGDGFHEVSELGYIETTPSGTGNYHTVIGTSLQNDIMPFIRYRVEDLVEPETGRERRPGGIGLPVKLRRVLGRMDEPLTAPDGRILLPVTIRMTIKPLLPDGVNYQLAQQDRTHYLLRLTGPARDDQRVAIIHALQSLLGSESRMDHVSVDSLQTRNGKIRNIINEQ